MFPFLLRAAAASARPWLTAAALLLTTPLLARSAASDLEIHHAWVRETPPGLSVAAGYFSAHNPSQRDIHIVAVRSPLARQAHLHESRHIDGQVRMLPVEGGLAVPAGASVTLAPGGYHVMLMGLNGSPRAGEQVPLVLELDDGSTVNINAAVRRASEAGTHAAH